MTSIFDRPAVRNSVRALTSEARRMTAGRRALPDFLIIGAQKAGSTSLYAYLSGHSQIIPAARKEVHYFDVNYRGGERWYRSMFPLERRLSRHSAGAITGEASPYYLFHPLAPERARALIPDARLIVLLRDPVERAWSHYRHEVAAGREELSFEAALDAEPARLRGAEDAVFSHPDSEHAALHRNASYASRGMYAAQLRRWLDVFPRESLHIVEAESLFASPAAEFAHTLTFLGLPNQTPRQGFRKHNPGTDGHLDAGARARLIETFQQPNFELTALLGREFAWSGPATPQPTANRFETR